jgi:biotin carboxylase
MSHVLVIHRWRDHYSLYASYLDHAATQVTYVTTAMGAASVPPAAAAAVTVGATDDLAQVRAAADQLIARFGAPERIVALNEGDLDTAAELRAALGTQGQQPADLAPFRDKLTMVRAVAAAGLATPQFADAPDEAAVLAFGERHGWPVIVKPRRGTASRAVLKIDGPGDLAELRGLAPEPRVVQTFCPDPILHVDGLWTGTELGPWRASAYLNTCVEFTTGEVLGSVEVDDPALLGPLGEFTAAIAGALSAEPWVFHLEVFAGGDPGDPPRLTFLEAGYRTGGAEIPFVWREVHGIDLMSAAIGVQLGRVPDLPVPARWRTAGWLLVPTPVPAPCRVVAADLWLDPDEGPYAQVVPPVGYRVPKVGGYEHVGARFRFQGETTNEVEKAIRRTAAQFRLDCVPDP